MQDIIIKVTPAADIMAQFNNDFYPTGAPDALTDPTGYEIYAKRQKAVDDDAAEYRERFRIYISNKNKIWAMALGQCDQGILSIIKQSDGWRTNKTNLFCVLRKIREASHARGLSSNVLYLDLIDDMIELFRTYQNQKSLNKFYQEFVDAMNTLNNRDAIL
mmetsp:Transcript_19516/g.30054  ORF Transcript_19516/g.30054 Transcript_19516/m.30054 type:complete len:161 (-) Transcript_19516:99-581(-)